MRIAFLTGLSLAVFALLLIVVTCAETEKQGSSTVVSTHAKRGSSGNSSLVVLPSNWPNSLIKPPIGSLRELVELPGIGSSSDGGYTYYGSMPWGKQETFQMWDVGFSTSKSASEVENYFDALAVQLGCNKQLNVNNASTYIEISKAFSFGYLQHKTPGCYTLRVEVSK